MDEQKDYQSEKLKCYAWVGGALLALVIFLVIVNIGLVLKVIHLELLSKTECEFALDTSRAEYIQEDCFIGGNFIEDKATGKIIKER